MGILSKWFGTKYNDDKIVSCVQQAIADDPLLTDATTVTVSSQDGVVTIEGVVLKEDEVYRIEGVVRSTLKNIGLKYDRIVNGLKVTSRKVAA